MSHNYWPTPGAGTLRMGMLTRALKRLGYDVTVVSLGDEPKPSEMRGPQGEAIVEVGSARVPRIVNLARLAMRAATLIIRRPSIVITDPPPVVAAPMLLLARSLGIPSTYYLSDSWQAVAKASPQRFLRWVSPLFGILDFIAFRATDAVIAVTDTLAERVEARAPGKVFRHPNGIDLSTYGPDGAEWRPPSGFPDRYLVYAGNSGQVHGSHVFIDAADQLQAKHGPFGLVYITYGSHAEEARSSAAECATPVMFLDKMPAADVATIVRGAVAALSSIRDVPGYYDARPIKALAGIACGVPIAYVGTGTFATIIKDAGLGYAFPYSTDGAASAMRESLTLTASERESHRIRALTFAKTSLDQAAIATRIASSIHQLAAPSGARH